MESAHTGLRRSGKPAVRAGWRRLADRRRYAEWEALVDLLMRTDHMLATGAITVPQHEMVWWQAYDRVKAEAHA
jgi:Family of unknown function (DUF6611)